MKTILPAIALLASLAFPSFSQAAGNTAIVEIDHVSEIKVEENKITIKGSAVVKRRTVSTAEKADDKVFGGPAQWLNAKVHEATFVIVPYNSPGIYGVPTGGHGKEELKQLAKQQWKVIFPFAKTIKQGDSVRIRYQGDKTTINGYYVTEVIGYGHLEPMKKTDG